LLAAHDVLDVRDHGQRVVDLPLQWLNHRGLGSVEGENTRGVTWCVASGERGFPGSTARHGRRHSTGRRGGGRMTSRTSHRRAAPV
jgi:hypothetical protein